jgi:hypothetical protein
MAVTTEDLNIAESPEPAPVTPPKSPHVVLGWAAAVAGLAAATALAVAVLTPDHRASSVDSGRLIAEHGSITAIDHRDAQIADRVAEAQGFDRHLETQAAQIAREQTRGSDRHLENHGHPQPASRSGDPQGAPSVCLSRARQSTATKVSTERATLDQPACCAGRRASTTRSCRSAS